VTDTLPFGLDARAHHHRGDPDTSVNAAVEACEPERVTARLRTVMSCHSAHVDGLTDDELQRLLPELGHTAKARRVDLRDAGLVADHGQRRATRKGRPAVVWTITPEGVGWCSANAVPVWAGPMASELDQAQVDQLTAVRLAGECPLCGRQQLGRAGLNRHLRMTHKADQ